MTGIHIIESLAISYPFFVASLTIGSQRMTVVSGDVTGRKPMMPSLQPKKLVYKSCDETFMKRSTFNRRGAVPTWKCPRKPKLAIPKATGARLDGGKGPWRSKPYRDSVKEHPCLVCGAGAEEAHHVRESLPRTMGRRVGDEWCVPLCKLCHSALHASSRTFWERQSIDPQNWCVLHRHQSSIWQEHLRKREKA